MGGAEQQEQEVVAVRENSEITEERSDGSRRHLNSFGVSKSPVQEGRAEEELQTPDPHTRAAHMRDSTQPAGEVTGSSSNNRNGTQL